MRLVVLEPQCSGHHEEYLKALLAEISNYFSELILLTSSECADRFQGLIENRVLVRKMPKFIIGSCKSKNVIVRTIGSVVMLLYTYFYVKRVKGTELFLPYFDSLVIAFALVRRLFKSWKVVATIHHAPTKKLKQTFLDRSFMNSNLTMVVHSERIREKIRRNLSEDHGKRVLSVDYPSFQIQEPVGCHVDRLTQKFFSKKSVPIMLYFGGLRYDKGIDILFRALRKVNRNVEVRVVGSEDYFTEKYILKEANAIGSLDKGVVIKPKISYVSDEEKVQNFLDADFIVLPYRKMFSGQSGPLVEGIAHGCIPIVPNIDILASVVENLGAGLVYEAEDPNSLAQAIVRGIDELEVHKKAIQSNLCKFLYKHSLKKFCDGQVLYFV
jgi:glycosyltransferase involved in cell wall biosynthesis